ncbi:Geranylgeranyl transferase type I subunit beta [Plasmodiophora brassicae]
MVPIMDCEVERRFFGRHLEALPSVYAPLCSNRMTLLYFTVAALDLLDARPAGDAARAICAWIMAQFVRSDRVGGFRGGSYLGASYDPSGTMPVHRHDEGHLAMTYTALCTLFALEYDFAGFDWSGIVRSMGALQRSDGSFAPTIASTDIDSRFTFCACAVAWMAGDWSGIDRDLATGYLLKCVSFDGAFGFAPGQEGHGGSTYIAVASLFLMGRLDRLSRHQRRRTIAWCIRKQGDGYHGRTNKPADSCYSYWLGAALRLLGAEQYTAKSSNRDFNLSCKTVCGGFGKLPGCDPDLMHSMMGTAGLSIIGMDSSVLLPFDVAIGVTARTSSTIHTRSSQ